jgi:hypothetical protein
MDSSDEKVRVVERKFSLRLEDWLKSIDSKVFAINDCLRVQLQEFRNEMDDLLQGIRFIVYICLALLVANLTLIVYLFKFLNIF